MAQANTRRRPTAPDFDKLRRLVLEGKSKSEIRRDMKVSSGAQVDALMFRLCQLDKKVYDPLPGGRILDELVVGKNKTMSITEAKLDRFSWIKAGDKFRITTDGQDIVLKYMEEQEQLTE